MSPEAAKVFIAEDDPKWMEYQKNAMSRGGHKVVIEVSDVEEGITAIPVAKELGVNVALVDGRIPADPTDGTRLAKALYQAIPNIKVVDISSFGDAVEYANAKMAKIDFNIDNMGQLVKDL